MSEEEEIRFKLENKLLMTRSKAQMINLYLNKLDEAYELAKELQQKENIIKEVREDLDKQITFCTNEANGTTNDKYCRIAINYLKHLLEILDKGE